MTRALTAISVCIAVVVLLALLTPTCTPSRDLESPNIVLVVIDALRPDHLGCYGYDRPTSPNLDRLADESIVFDNAIAAAPWTKTSFSSFLTGLYPFQHGVVGWESIMPDSIVTLPEMLRDSGYETVAIVNMLGITGRFKVLTGFERISEAAKYKRDAAKTTSDAIDILTGLPQPFFVLIHYFDTHWPYRPPVKYIDKVSSGASDVLSVRQQMRKSDLEKPPDEVVKRDVIYYDACIRFVDDEVARLIQFLESEGLRDNTVIIVTADHGEAFWEHGFGSHGHSLYDEEIKVPLIINNPVKYPRGKRIANQVSLIDLTPTIASLAGITDKHHREGRNLISLIDGKPDVVPADRLLPGEYDLCECTLRKSPDSKGVRSLTWKIIIEPSTALIQLYNLKQDPRETVNLWGSEKEMGDSLLALLERVRGTRLGGWRIGFTGSPQDHYVVKVMLMQGGRFRLVRRLVAGEGTSIKVSSDSTYFEVDVSPKQQQIIHFDTAPHDAEVSFEVMSNTPTYVGAKGTRHEKSFSLMRSDALGLPQIFDENRSSWSPGTYIWWLPGGESIMRKSTTKLTPEEIKRLKALGYIQ